MYSPNIYVLYLTFGVLTGVGAALMYVGNVGLLYYYFDRKRTLATSVFVTGSPAIATLVAFATPHWINSYGYEGALLLLGGLALNGIPMGMLLRDPSYLQTTLDEKPQEVANNEKTKLVKTKYDRESSTGKKTSDKELKEDDTDETPAKQSTSKQWICDTLGLQLFKNWMFVVFMIAVSLSCVPHDSLLWFIPDRATEIGLSPHTADLTVTVYTTSNFVSRVFMGITLAESFENKINTFFLYSFTSGVNIGLATLWHNVWLYMTFVSLYGLMRGLFKMLQMSLLVDFAGKENVHHGFGWIMTFSGLGYLVFIPLFGYLNESTGSYIAAFLGYAGLEIFGSFLLLSIRIWLLLKRFNYA